jgi:hypothetical protein
MDELSRLRRDAVARLCQAQAEGRLSIEAFQERYALLAEAETAAAVRAIAAAFQSDSGGYEVVRFEPAPPPEPEYAPVPATRMPAILGSLVRAGNWNVPEEIDLLVIFGEAKLDLREASFAADTVVINLSMTVGSLELTVLPGTQIENDCHLVITSSEHKRPRKRRAAPNGLTVILQGRSTLGGITIRERDVDEPATLLQRMGLSA